MDYFSDLLSQEIRRIVREEVKACLQEEDAKTNQKIAAALRMAADSIETGAKDTPSSILLNDFKNYEEGIPSANSPKKSEKMEEIDKSSVPDLAEEKNVDKDDREAFLKLKSKSADEDEVKNYNPGDKLPVFIVLDENREVERFTGEFSYDDLEKKLKDVGVLNEEKN